MKFNTIIKSLRISHNLTQEDLAEKLYVDNNKISKWERGLSVPKYDEILSLCQLFNITPNELFDYQNKRHKSTFSLIILVILIFIISIIFSYLIIKMSINYYSLNYENDYLRISGNYLEFINYHCLLLNQNNRIENYNDQVIITIYDNNVIIYEEYNNYQVLNNRVIELNKDINVNNLYIKITFTNTNIEFYSKFNVLKNNFSKINN